VNILIDSTFKKQIKEVAFCCIFVKITYVTASMHEETLCQTPGPEPAGYQSAQLPTHSPLSSPSPINHRQPPLSTPHVYSHLPVVTYDTNTGSL